MNNSDLSEGLKAAQELQEFMAKQTAQNKKNPNFCKQGPAYELRCKEWAKRDYWTLDEAANLLCGTDPKRYYLDAPEHMALNREVQDMQELIKRADITKQGTFTKQVPAKDVMAWAKKKGLDVPDALLAAMGHKPAAEGKPAHGNTVKNEEKREAVLGAAIVALVKYHHQCLDRGGKVSATQIAKVIEQNQSTLFKEGSSPQAVDTMARLIGKYLKE